MKSNEKPCVFICFQQKVLKNIDFLYVSAKVNLLSQFPWGSARPGSQKALEQLWPEWGTKKCPMFPDLLQNHCILLCFEGIRAQGTFFSGPAILPEFTKAPKIIEFLWFLTITSGCLEVPGGRGSGKEVYVQALGV